MRQRDNETGYLCGCGEQIWIKRNALIPRLERYCRERAKKTGRAVRNFGGGSSTLPVAMALAAPGCGADNLHGDASGLASGARQSNNPTPTPASLFFRLRLNIEIEVEVEIQSYASVTFQWEDSVLRLDEMMMGGWSTQQGRSFEHLKLEENQPAT